MIVFVRGAALVMQLVNIAARRVEGEPVVLAENLTLTFSENVVAGTGDIRRSTSLR